MTSSEDIDFDCFVFDDGPSLSSPLYNPQKPVLESPSQDNEEESTLDTVDKVTNSMLKFESARVQVSESIPLAPPAVNATSSIMKFENALKAVSGIVSDTSEIISEISLLIE